MAYLRAQKLSHPDKNGDSAIANDRSARLNPCYAQLRELLGTAPVMSIPMKAEAFCDVDPLDPSAGDVIPDAVYRTSFERYLNELLPEISKIVSQRRHDRESAGRRQRESAETILGSFNRTLISRKAAAVASMGWQPPKFLLKKKKR